MAKFQIVQYDEESNSLMSNISDKIAFTCDFDLGNIIDIKRQPLSQSCKRPLNMLFIHTDISVVLVDLTAKSAREIMTGKRVFSLMTLADRVLLPFLIRENE